MPARALARTMYSKKKKAVPYPVMAKSTLIVTASLYMYNWNICRSANVSGNTCMQRLKKITVRGINIEKNVFEVK